MGGGVWRLRPSTRGTPSTRTWVTPGRSPCAMASTRPVPAEPVMDPDHVGSAVAYMASLPLDANVQFMTVMATKMPFIGRG